MTTSARASLLESFVLVCVPLREFVPFDDRPRPVVISCSCSSSSTLEDFAKQRRHLLPFKQKSIVALGRCELSILRARNLGPLPHVDYRIVKEITRNPNADDLPLHCTQRALNATAAATNVVAVHS